MMIFSLLTLMGVIVFFPRTEMARALRFWLVETPAAKLNAMSRRKAILSVLGFIAMLVLAPVLVEAAIPMEVAALMAGDLALYFEAVLAVGLMTARGRMRAGVRFASDRLAAALSVLRHPRRRSVRRRGTRPVRGGRRQDDPDPGFAFA